MLSFGMLAALASATMVRSRGFIAGSPPPTRAATVSSLMMRVKILPRLASRAPFLCLMECHLEWPDITADSSSRRRRLSRQLCRAARQDHPGVGAIVPWAAVVVAEDRLDLETGALQATSQRRQIDRAERQREATTRPGPAASFDELLVEGGEPPLAILAHGLDELDWLAGRSGAFQRQAALVFAPARHVGHEVDAEQGAGAEHAVDGREGPAKIGFPGQRLQDAIRRHHQAERGSAARQVADVAAQQRRAETRRPCPRPGPGSRQLGTG